MDPISINIDDEVFSRFSSCAVYAVRVDVMHDTLSQTHTAMLLRQAITTFGPNAMDRGADVIAGWRDVYKTMGVKPSRYKSSIESLIRRASKLDDIVLPIPSVNLYNACSMETMAPIGGYDINRLPGNGIVLRNARETDDTFLPIGGTASDFPLDERVVVYAADSTVLCWGFNCRDSQVAALTEKSVSGLFLAEAVKEDQHTRAVQGLTRLKMEMSQLGATCGEIVGANYRMSSVTC